MHFNLFRITLGVALIVVATHNFAADLTITVDGVTAGEGEVLIALYDNANGFPATQPKISQKTSASATKVSFVFKDMTPGRYAFSAFQDKNSNARLDVSAIGIPIEPYGFSKNAHGSFGLPKFDDAAVTIKTEALSINIHLK